MRGILPGHQQRCLERGEAGDEEGDDEPHGQTETEVQVGGLETPQCYNVSIETFREIWLFWNLLDLQEQKRGYKCCSHCYCGFKDGIIVFQLLFSVTLFYYKSPCSF